MQRSTPAVSAMAPTALASLALPELIALWFVLGIGLLAGFGFAGLALHAKLSHLVIAVAASYALLAVAVAARLVVKHARALAGPRETSSRLVCAILLGLAVGAGLLTLVTPHDVDDWYYLAYIRDFAADHPLRSENAIVSPGSPAPQRIWYASWWVVEAMLSRASGVDPIASHQVCLPLLIVPFSMLAAFMLARRVFRSERMALLASAFQMLFYLSSAYPYNTAGWFTFCRMSQDKALACFVMVPVAIALALMYMERRKGFYRRDQAPQARLEPTLCTFLLSPPRPWSIP
jgi:hypothetical protein